MTQLIDRFNPKEILHIVGISNKLKILNTDEKKFLLAVRMGTPYTDGAYELDSEEKGKFPPVFMKFMNQFPMNYYCEKEDCPVCERLKDLKFDFQENQETQEYFLMMNWVATQTPEEESFQEEAPEENLVDETSEEQPPAKEAPVEEAPVKEGEPKGESRMFSYPFGEKSPGQSQENPSPLEVLVNTNPDLMDEDHLRKYTDQLQQELKLQLHSWEILLEQEEDPLRKMAAKELLDTQKRILGILRSKSKKGIIPA